MKNIEERLNRLEELSDSIRDSALPLEDAIALFDEGIKLVRGMEKDLDKMEGKIQILMNQPDISESENGSENAPKTKPELDLFSSIE